MANSWKTCHDDKVCAACAELDGIIVTSASPPHPNCTSPDGCRCVLGRVTPQVLTAIPQAPAITVKIVIIFLNSTEHAHVNVTLPAIPPPGSYVIGPGCGEIGLTVHSSIYATDCVVLQVREEKTPPPYWRERMIAAGWEFVTP